MQSLHDVTVVIPTVLRPSLETSVRSIFRQDLAGRIQILIGVDRRLGDAAFLRRLEQECPANMAMAVLDLGYSTSARYGGLYSNGYSGALRTILSYAANSRFVAYLDDDDWWARDHLSTLLTAIQGKDWAFSYRWLVDPETGWPICRDEWDAVGPGRGINQQKYGGFVNPSSLLLDKCACHFVLPYWAFALFEDGTSEDRVVFHKLLESHEWAASGRHTSFYSLSVDAQKHAHHAREFAARGIGWTRDRSQVGLIARLARETETLLAGNRVEEAIEAARQLLAMNPCHGPTLRRLALAERRCGKLEEAVIHDGLAAEILDGFPADRPVAA